MITNKFIIKLLNILLLMLCFANSNAQDEMFRDAELKLNNYYKKILRTLSEKDQIKFKQAQHQWIIFRDLDCKWAYTATPFHCLTNRTKNRIKELQELMLFDETFKI